MGCGYCVGWRSLCACTQDCGTDRSPIGPCPLSVEGQQIIEALQEEDDRREH